MLVYLYTFLATEEYSEVKEWRMSCIRTTTVARRKEGASGNWAKALEK